MKNWINESVDSKSIVISSRIRLARNFEGRPFPNKISEESGKELVNLIMENFESYYNLKNYKKMKLWEGNNEILHSYLEKHFISSKLIKNGNRAGIIINNEETVSIMLNEEDHIRLQCITSGFDLKEAYDMANKIDNFIESKMDYSFDEKLGYLTCCPTNLGTAMRASVMVHLPAITLNNEITRILKGLTQVGMTIRGLYGEGSEAYGNMYQISNQVSLGINEEEILNNLEAVVCEIMLQEKNARMKLLSNSEFEIKDKIFRALGILQNSYIIDLKESLNLMSYVRLGVENSIIESIDTSILNKLLIDVQPANLQLNLNKKLSTKERDIERARILRENLK